eukprot:scaffold20355_cov62-Isochrysis_galbana.AAC.1
MGARDRHHSTPLLFPARAPSSYFGPPPPVPLPFWARGARSPVLFRATRRAAHLKLHNGSCARLRVGGRPGCLRRRNRHQERWLSADVEAPELDGG